MPKRILVAATGDSLITRRMPPYEDVAFTEMVRLIQSADVRFTNLEVTLSNFRGSPAVEPAGINLSAEPAVAADLMRMGFNLTAFANNHALDYGEEGCLKTLDVLAGMGLVCAGAGRTLADARLPAFLETPRGRIGLVACASSFSPGQHAAAQRPDVPGRPGVNPQRFDTLYIVDQEHWDAVRRIAERTGAESLRQRWYWMGFSRPPQREGQFVFADRSFIVGEEFGVRTEPHEGDLAANARAVRAAREMSDLTLVSIHAHAQGAERWEPAEFITTFARACVDAGADMVIGHGPHLLRGLELYRGKPIFYSLGNYIFQVEYLQRIAADGYEIQRVDPDRTAPEVFREMSKDDTRSFGADRMYWETVLPLCTFEDRRVVQIRLYPVSLGFGAGRPDRGTPRLAPPSTAGEILTSFASLSRPFGTEMAIDGGIGEVTLS